MSSQVRLFVLACTIVAATALQAQGRKAKDIVLDDVSAAWVTQGAPTENRNDAMVVSVLLEAADGTLTPRSTAIPFNTGDRFRVKILGSRASRVSLYNTKPNGILTPKPIWHGELKPGQETITPRLMLDGASGSGTDQLHVVLEPLDAGSAASMSNWLGDWISNSRAGKDIRLDSQDTPSATYLATDPGKGLVSTIQINHR